MEAVPQTSLETSDELQQAAVKPTTPPGPLSLNDEDSSAQVVPDSQSLVEAAPIFASAPVVLPTGTLAFETNANEVQHPASFIFPNAQSNGHTSSGEPSDGQEDPRSNIDHSPREHNYIPPSDPSDAPAVQPVGSHISPNTEGTATHPPQTSTQSPSQPVTPPDQHVPATGSPFTVTPPLRPARGPETPAPLRPLDSSAWQSTFPFQTQLSAPHPSTVTALNSHIDLSTRAASLPVAQTSPTLISSPIPAVPSQPADTHPAGVQPFGESAPARPLTFSTSPRTPNHTMSSSNSQPSSGRGELQARIQAERAKLHAERAARKAAGANSNSATPQSANKSSASANANLSIKLASPFVFEHETARSPSAVPAQMPLPVITLEDQTTAGRYETLLPQAQDAAAEDSQNNTSRTVDASAHPAPSGTGEDSETANVRAVPIYLIGHQRDQYPQMVYFYRDTIRRFLTSQNPDAPLIAEVERFVERLRHVTLHPDLDNDGTATQYDVQPAQQADWDARCSAKFRFLKDLLAGLKGSQVRIAIVSQPGRISDILETFLQGLGVPYSRPGSSLASDGQSDGQQVVLLDTDSTTSDKPIDLVVAMDNSVKFDTKPIQELRRNGSKWAPFITLVVPRSVEHIERCLSTTLPLRAYLRALVSGIHQYKDEAGRNFTEHVPKKTGQTFAQHLLHIQANEEASSHDWPLPPLTDLPDLDSQTDSEQEVANTNNTEANARTGEKRSREPSEDDIATPADLNKRSRRESPQVELPATNEITQHVEAIDVTHISDSMGKPTQPSDASEQLTTSTPALSKTEQRLQTLLQEAQDRLEENVKVLSDLQYRYEEQRTDVLRFTAERDDAIATAQQALTRLSEESNKLSNWRVENSSLREQLKEANVRLKEHSVPERAEFETLRLAVAQGVAEKEKLERRLEGASKDTAYVRELYQNSSSTAQAMVVENDELKTQLATAERKAEGEQVKLRQLGHDALTTQLVEENRRLKVVLKEREMGLRLRDEEIARLKEASAGRMGTRGTSVPRSPRPGSRQASPAAGELRGRAAAAGMLHPLRNA